MLVGEKSLWNFDTPSALYKKPGNAMGKTWLQSRDSCSSIKCLVLVTLMLFGILVASDLKVDLKMASYKRDIEKDVILDIQIKLADVLIIERDIQVANQKSNLDNFLILETCLVQRDKEKK